jgi:hypothetical protein
MKIYSEIPEIREILLANKDNLNDAVKLISDFIGENYVPKYIYDRDKEQLDTIHRNVQRNILGNMDWGNEMGH